MVIDNRLEGLGGLGGEGEGSENLGERYHCECIE